MELLLGIWTLCSMPLTHAPFEPEKSVLLYYSAIKITFLTAIASPRRASELGAFSVDPSCFIFYKDKVVLRMIPFFIPNINFNFSLSQEFSLPSFCPHPSHPKKQLWHLLGIRWALKFYQKRTENIRKTAPLLIVFHLRKRCVNASKSSVSRWTYWCIAEAYRAKGLNPPESIQYEQWWYRGLRKGGSLQWNL